MNDYEQAIALESEERYYDIVNVTIGALVLYDAEYLKSEF